MLSENNFQNREPRFMINEYCPPEFIIIHKLKSLIEENFKKNKDQEFYSEELGISLNRLNNLSKIYLGKNVYQLIQNRIHEEALYLLRYTTLSIKQITYELELTDQGYFCRCFKKITGLRPSQYRKANQIVPLFLEKNSKEFFS